MEETAAITENSPAKPTKKTQNRAQLNESTLLQPNKGLKRLYQITQSFIPSNNPKSDLQKLLNLFKEWHFVVAPKFEFNYFVQKCQTLGTKAPIRGYMNRLRDFHSGKLTEEELDNPLSVLNEPNADLEEDNVYESPEKLFPKEKAGSENEKRGSKDLDEGEKAGGVSPKIIDFFDLIEEGNQDENEYLNEIAREGNEDEMEYLNEIARGGINKDEMEYLNEIAMEGSGKRMNAAEDEDESFKQIKGG